MPDEIKLKLVRGKLPFHYRHHPLTRGFMLVFASVVMLYSLYFLIRYVRGDMPLFFKLLPMIIIFVALDSILRKVTCLNKVSFYVDNLTLSFMLKRSIVIPYADVVSLQLKRKITYYLAIGYRDRQGKLQYFTTPASFPKMLEILLNIADQAPQAELTDKLPQVIEYLRSNVVE